MSTERGPFLVRSHEHEGKPIIGRYVQSEEAGVLYTDAEGKLRTAPDDCVTVEHAVNVSVAEYIEWIGED